MGPQLSPSVGTWRSLVITEYFQNAFFHGKALKGGNTAVHNDSNDDLGSFIWSYFKIQFYYCLKEW